jgi:hypothetical protein
MPQSTTTATPTPAIDPADFVSVIDNSYFPLTPGTTYITESPDGSAVDRFAVTRQTRLIDGVECVVVSDIATEDGALVEKTSDFFAQDRDGNVWYFGEQTAEYEDGKVVSTEGSWLAGVDGAEPGIVMEANPKVGDAYAQENAPGVAEDRAEVLSLNRHVTVPYGSFNHALETNEFSPLEPGSSEHKYYVKGIGFVLAVDQVTGEVEQLVKIRQDGTQHADTLTGNVGVDELHGHGGNDRLDGGKDRVADLLHGDAGNDWLVVRSADHAFGDSGNDTFFLASHAHFGSIDGGSEHQADLALAEGDILEFAGKLDLTHHDLADRIAGIETLSMRGGHRPGALTLDARDVLDLGEGHFDPAGHGRQNLGWGEAVRVDGDCGDRLHLSGSWTEVHAGNAPAGYDVFAAHAGGGTAYVLVQEEVSVHAG